MPVTPTRRAKHDLRIGDFCAIVEADVARQTTQKPNNISLSTRRAEPHAMSAELVFKAKVGDFGDFHLFEGINQACK
jgi:hypothetical protein